MMKDILAVRKRWDDCTDFNDVVSRYARLDELFSYLQGGGKFRTRKELYGSRTFREQGGVYIHIDREGNPVFGGGGCHRLALAKILQLDIIPAQLGIVHHEAVDLWRTKMGHEW